MDTNRMRMSPVEPLGKPCFKVYVLVLFVLAYLLNQLDRYVVSIVSQPMAQDVHFGDKGCIDDLKNFTKADIGNHTCTNILNETRCEMSRNAEHHRVCYWDYNGQGFDYEVLAGPVFIIVYTFAGIPLGFWADVYSRKVLLGVSVLLWSTMTLLMGFVNQYWQLVLLRFGQGIGEAGCTPFATSLIADYFSQDRRALAIGVYNWGIYLGYSMSYAIGNFITTANILNQGWRWTFYLSGMPGLLLGPLILLTVKEPARQLKRDQQDASDVQSLLGHHETEQTFCQKVAQLCRTFCRPSVILLFIAGSIRNAAGYVWSYNTQIYFRHLGQTPEEIGKYMSWIPVVGGCLGVVLGGLISDRVVRRVGPHARVMVLFLSQIAAAPFVAGALFFSPPWAYLCLIPGYIIGEMWVGVTLAVLVELVPTPLRTVGVAVYLFVISNVGGNMAPLVTPLQRGFQGLGYTSIQSLRAALYVLYPGLYVLASILFLFTMFVLKWDLNRLRHTGYEEIG